MVGRSAIPSSHGLQWCVAWDAGFSAMTVFAATTSTVDCWPHRNSFDWLLCHRRHMIVLLFLFLLSLLTLVCMYNLNPMLHPRCSTMFCSLCRRVPYSHIVVGRRTACWCTLMARSDSQQEASQRGEANSFPISGPYWQSCVNDTSVAVIAMICSSIILLLRYLARKSSCYCDI
jgi:hypothetical protein